MSRDEREPGEEEPQAAGEAPPASESTPPVAKARPQRSFADLWRNALPVVSALIPKQVSPERLFALAVTARQRSEKLMACSELSILRGVIQAAQLGLDVSGVGGMAYLVPYFNSRTRQFEAQMQVGYKGLIDLARRGGRVLYIRAREVYENEAFEYEDGPLPILRHIPMIGGEDPGPLRCAWAVAVFPDNQGRPAGIQPEVMSGFQIEKVRKSSKAQDDGPWVTHPAEMWRKTVIKRLCKMLPQDRDLATALDIEDRAEAGQIHDIDLELGAIIEPEGLAAPATRTEQVKQAVARRRKP